MEFQTIVFIVIIVCMGAFIRAFVGFGDALLAMPLLSLLINFEKAAPLVAGTSILISAALSIKLIKSIQWKTVLILTVLTSLGIPIGLWLLKTISQEYMSISIGLFLIIYSFFFLIQIFPLKINTDLTLPIFGFVAGIFGGACTMNGPPVVIFGTLRGWSPLVFKGTLQGYFLISGTILLVFQGTFGMWSTEELKVLTLAIPGITIGLILGLKLSKKITPLKFHKVVYKWLMVLGMLLIINGIIFGNV